MRTNPPSPSVAFQRLALLLFAVALAGFLTACATPRQPAIPMGDLAIGIAPFTQPEGPQDMLAGFQAEPAPQVEMKTLFALDDAFAQVLASNTMRTYVPAEKAQECLVTVRAANRQQAALRTWSQVGRCMGVDVLIVPQILEWRERDGGEMGVATPAGIIMDIFVLDVKNESLISRSRYDETQTSLMGNLLEARKFVRRGGRWVTALDLAREGMEKAIKELGL